MGLKLKSTNKDLTSRIITTLKRARPREEDHGTYTVARANLDSPSAIDYIVTTGIRTFDERVGGLPVGKVTEIFGLPACGKTHLAVRVAVRAQQGFIYKRVPAKDAKTFKMEKLKPGTYDVTVLYYDNESALSEPYMKMVDGVTMDGIIEQCDTVDLLWETMEKVADMVAEEETVTKRLQILVIVIDTVASLVSKSDMKREWGKKDFPRSPQELKEGFRIMVRKLTRHNVLLIGTNHVSKRMKVEVGPGSTPAYRAWDYDSPGGQAFKYYSHHRIYLEPMRVKYRVNGLKGPAEGFLIYFFTEKSRLRPPLREGRMALLFGERAHDTGEVISEGGFNDTYSVLETLIFSKAAEIAKKSRKISFKFHSFGIKTTTFTPEAPSLEDQADQPAAKLDETEGDGEGEGEELKRKTNPTINDRSEWPAFYAAHTADVEALFAEANRRAFQSVNLSGSEDEEDEEEED